MRRRVVVPVLVAAALVGAEVATRDGDRPKRPAAPALPAQVLAGRRVTLAGLRGRPAIVNFWASWCEPCKKEAPELQRLAAAGVHVVGVDWGDAAGAARAFVRRHRWTFPVLRDATNDVGDAYGIGGLPTTFVLDRDGRIAATLRGPQTAASLRTALRLVSQH